MLRDMARQVQKGTVLGGRYRLEDLIGSGGMGSVYAAYDLDQSHRVAVKLLNSRLAKATEFRDRFLGESKLASSIPHPHILTVFDHGEDGGWHYLAMRLVEDELAAMIENDGPLDVPRALTIADQVAWALDVAHERGLVHRDVKPENVLVTPRRHRDEPDHAYLADSEPAAAAPATRPEHVPAGPAPRRLRSAALVVLAAVAVAAIAAASLLGDDPGSISQIPARVGTIDGEPVRLQITELSRSDSTATLQLRLTLNNPRGNKAQVDDEFSDGVIDGKESPGDDSDTMDGISLLDTKNSKRYTVFRDEAGRCVCDRDLSNVSVTGAAPVVLSVSFGGLPDDIDSIEILIPRFGTFGDVPLES